MQPTEYIVHGGINLCHRGVLRIEDGKEMVVYVWHGRAWLTQMDEDRDIVLGPGDWFRLDRPGVAIVSALEDSVLSLTSPREDRFADGVYLRQPGARALRPLYRPGPGAPSRLQRGIEALRAAWRGLWLPGPGGTAGAR